jgi:3-methyladenine DNA glycosylase AlkD
MTRVDEIRSRLESAGSARNVAGMARYGIRPKFAYGVAAPVMRAMAKEIGRDQALASDLWSTGVHEARILAAFVADPKSITEAQVEAWVHDFDSWAVCDSTCLHLLWRTPFAWQKVAEWSAREAEYERRAAFALVAALAVHDKKALDKQFRAALQLIRKAAADERNFVKKAVNWALRQIGKRNPALHEAAIATAEKLAAGKFRSARWIGADALRELCAGRARPLGAPGAW